MIPRNPIFLLAAFLLLSTTHNASAAEWIEAFIGDYPVRLQVALTETEQRQGLMGTQELPADNGMLFVFRPERPVAMWMKNTPIDLDLAYLDARAQIVSLGTMKALTTDLHESNGPVGFAIEMPAHWFRYHRIPLGASVRGIEHFQTFKKQKRP